jgi:hypothetical protein
MRRLFIYFTILLDIGLFFLVDALKLAYGLKNNDISASTFETYKSTLVPMRDNYLVLTLVTNLFLIGILTTKYFKHRDRIHLATIEKVGLTISIITLLTLGFVKLFVPKGPFF